MAEQTQSQGGTIFGMAFVLLFAALALGVFKFNLFGVQDYITGRFGSQTIENGPTITDDGERPQRDPRPAEPEFPKSPPDDAPFRKHRDTPLPERLEIPITVGEYTTSLTMLHVPQGWFIMGEDDGVSANMPKRWVWMDDFYLAETETTNAQFFAFVLADGYRREQFWSPEGYTHFASRTEYRGNRLIGWRTLRAGNRSLWGLASPDNEVTIEIVDDRGRPLEDCHVMVVPSRGAWSRYMHLDADRAITYYLTRNQWVPHTGRELIMQSEVQNSGYLHRTDRNGRVDVGGLIALSHHVIAWVDGLDQPPLFGNIDTRTRMEERGPDMPTTLLTWFEADACARFFGGSLPTEAQWEKAARGVDGRPYPWGSELELGEEVEDDSRRITTPLANINRWQLMPAGSFPDSRGPFGHLDMIGNVTEWCLDVYMARPNQDQANPITRGRDSNTRVERGASTRDDEASVSRVYNRRHADPYMASESRGFRVAMTPEQALELARR
jgi:formylglycine-generating enzyme required for sulfatase activity